MSRATRWWWIRHAPVTQYKGRLYGQTDVDCDTGNAVALSALACRLPARPLCFVSPLKRTEQTRAALAAAGASLPDPVVQPALIEQDFGRWQGLKWNEMEDADPPAYAAFWRDPTRTAPPGGESFEAVMQRTRTAIEHLTVAHAGRDIVSVGHGGTIRAAVALALNLSPEAAMAVVVDNLSLTLLEHVADGLLRRRERVWRVQCVNLTCG
jgi:alpha-ribazole phosphatase